MKRFHEVITKLATWAPPEELNEVTFTVSLKTKEIKVEMRACCCFGERVFSAKTTPEEVHENLDEMAVSTIRFRDKTHAEKGISGVDSALETANADFMVALAKHAKRDQ